MQKRRMEETEDKVKFDYCDPRQDCVLQVYHTGKFLKVEGVVKEGTWRLAKSCFWRLVFILLFFF